MFVSSATNLKKRKRKARICVVFDLDTNLISKKGFLADVSCSLYTAAYYLPRHLAPNPAYPHPYPYLLRGFPDTAALENRQTLFNDFITSQQMHSWPAAQRSDLLRGIPPRDQPLSLPFSATPRGKKVGFVATPLYSR